MQSPRERARSARPQPPPSVIAAAHSPAALPSFASPAPYRPSTVPAGALLRRVGGDEELRSASSRASRVTTPARPGSSPRMQRFAGHSPPATAPPSSVASALGGLFSFADPTEAMFAASAGSVKMHRDRPDVQHMREATATSAQRHALHSASVTHRPAPPFSASPLSATAMAVHASSPPSQQYANRAIPRAEVLRFDTPFQLPADRPPALPREFELAKGNEGAVDTPAPQQRPARHALDNDSSEDDGDSQHAASPPTSLRSHARDDVAAVAPVSLLKPRMPLYTPSHRRESWATAARVAVPLQFDAVSLGTTSGSKPARSISQIQEETSRLMRMDQLRVYQLAHMDERQRRQHRDKPWRTNCALEAEAPPGQAPLTAAAAEVSMNDSVYSALSAQLTTLLEQHAATSSQREQQAREERFCRQLLFVRSSAADSIPPSTATSDAEAALENNLDPAARLIVQLQGEIGKSFIFDQLVERLLDPVPHPDANRGTTTPLVSAPLRFLLQRVHEHHQSILHPIRSLLQLLVSRISQERKIGSLLASVGGDSAHSAANAASRSHSDQMELGHDGETSARIHVLQKRRLHELSEGLAREYRSSLQLTQSLQETKEDLSARVHRGVFKQSPTQTQQLAASSADADADHASRHLYDYDLRSKTLVDARAPPADGSERRRYVEDSLEHALADEDPAAETTHYSHMAHARARAAAEEELSVASQQRLVAKVDPKHARHMPSLRAYLSSFRGGAPHDEEKESAGGSSNRDVLQTLLTRPLLRIHVLNSGDVLTGQVAFHSKYYMFSLSADESGAMLRIVQHPTDLSDSAQREAHAQAIFQQDDKPALLAVGDSVPAVSPGSAEDGAEFLDIYLNQGAPPTRLAHSHKASTRATGSAELDLRSLAFEPSPSGKDGTDLVPRTLGALSSSAAPSSLFSKGAQWFVRVIGRGMRAKGYTLELRTGAQVLDYSSVLDQLCEDLEVQSAWQQSLTDKLNIVDQLMLASVPAATPKPTQASQNGEATSVCADAASLVVPSLHPASSPYSDPSERSPSKDQTTQTYVSALHAIDVEASLRRRVEEDEAVAQEAARRAEEERVGVVSLGVLRSMFALPLVSRKQLRVWSQSTMLNLITAIYRARLSHDAAFAEQMRLFQLASIAPGAGATSTAVSVSGSRKAAPPPSVAPKRIPFPEFVFTYFLSRYGHRRLAETYLYEFVHSISSRYASLPRVSLFSRLAGCLTPHYGAPEAEWLMRLIGAQWKACNAHGIIPVDDEQGHCALPYYVIEDVLFDVFASTAHTAVRSKKRGSSDSDEDASSRAEERTNEVCQRSWAQMLLKKLRPLVVVRDAAPDDSRSQQFGQRQVTVRSYVMDSDDALQLLIDHGPRALTRCSDELKSVWARIFAAESLVAERERAERAAVEQSAANAGRPGFSRTQSRVTPQPESTAAAVAAARGSSRSGLRLPDFLGVMRVEFPWLDELELFLLFLECMGFQSATPDLKQSAKDVVSRDAFLRIGLRYELANPPAPEGSDFDTWELSGDSDGTRDATTQVLRRTAKPLVPVSQLHLTSSRLPFPCKALPGFKDLSSTAAQAKDSVASPGHIGGGKFTLAHAALWDELAVARVVPKRPAGAASLQPVGSGHGEAHRPKSLLDHHALLPPSISPPAHLRPRQSLRLLSGLFGLIRPLIVDSASQLQVTWSAPPGAAVSADLREQSEQLAKLYELLSDVQMRLDTRGAASSAINTQSAESSSPAGPAKATSQDLYDSDDEEEELVVAPASPKAAKAEAEAGLRVCWAAFRRLLAHATNLLSEQSSLRTHLLRLQDPDGRAVVARRIVSA